MDEVTSQNFKLKLKSDIVNVIRIIPNSIITESVTRRVYIDDEGNFKSSKYLDVVKIAVIERHNNTKNIGIGLVENFHLQNGAIATTISHDSHNIIVIGDSDEDMAIAVNKLREMQGGIVIASKKEVKASLALPIAGLMSEKTMEEVCEDLRKLRYEAQNTLNIPPSLEPFMTLSFMALPVIPELKITDKGYFDVKSFTFKNIEVEDLT